MGLVALDFFDVVNVDYGINTNDPLINNDGEDQIETPESTIQLTNEQLTHLQATINPLSDSDNYGIELYVQTLDIVQQMLAA